MSRGPVARSMHIDKPLPQALVTLMLMDDSALNHARIEGAPDPYPNQLAPGGERA